MRLIEMAVFASVLAVPLAAADDWCDEQRQERSGRVSHCLVREMTLPAGAVAIDSSPNGGIEVKAWDGREVRVEARVTAWAEDAEQAGRLASSVQIGGSPLRASGPESTRQRSFSVSYRVEVPAHTDLDLESLNGGLHVSGVEGRLALHTVNGGLHLSDIGGDVVARTTNGGVHVSMSAAFAGERFEVRTTNGGVHLDLPDQFDGRLELSTVNGRVHAGADSPRRRRGGRVDLTLGSGGPLLRASTTNGSVHLARR